MIKASFRWLRKDSKKNNLMPQIATAQKVTNVSYRDGHNRELFPTPAEDTGT